MTQAGRHKETRKRVDIYKSVSVACARVLHVHDRLFLTHTGRHGREKGLTLIRVRSCLARVRATRTGQTVCDPGRQGHEKGLTFIRV